MKLKKSEVKTVRTAYLYQDGHLVLVHTKKDKDAGEVNWVSIYEDIGISCYFKQPGRLIIDPAVLPFLTQCSSITVNSGNKNNGSENTRKLGIDVETIGLTNRLTKRTWFITNFPGVISSDIYFNNNDASAFDPDTHFWSDYRVKNIYRKE